MNTVAHNPIEEQSLVGASCSSDGIILARALFPSTQFYAVSHRAQFTTLQALFGSVGRAFAIVHVDGGMPFFVGLVDWNTDPGMGGMLIS